MNALIGARLNAIGQLLPNRAKRYEAAAEVSSSARTNIVGRQTKAAAVAKNGEVAVRAVKQELDQDAFLELLVTQMRFQDPMNPVDNAEMLAQLAQFTSLEQMNNLNGRMEMLSGNIDQLNYISAAALLGKNVVGVDTSGEEVEGMVTGVHLDGSVVYLTVGERMMSMAGVMRIAAPDESD